VGRRYRQAGANHGFDVTIPTLKSGPQPVCAYAVGIAGDEKLLGCKATRIAVAVTFSHIRATRTGVQLRISCAWPAGTECPGQLVLRTRFKVATPRRGRPPLIHVVTRSLGRRPFQLTGGRAHAFKIPFTAGGRLLLRQHGTLRTQLIAAIPGGRRVQAMSLQPR
jgi:hypothetical protein